MATELFQINDGRLIPYSGDSSVVIIPECVTQIGKRAFHDNKHITKVIIPNTVTFIDDAFEYCENLTEVIIPDSVTHIGDCAFYRCKGLADENGFVIVNGIMYDYFGDGSDIAIPNSVTNIDDYAFYYQKGMADQDGFLS